MEKEFKNIKGNLLSSITNLISDYESVTGKRVTRLEYTVSDVDSDDFEIEIEHQPSIKPKQIVP